VRARSTYSGVCTASGKGPPWNPATWYVFAAASCLPAAAQNSPKLRTSGSHRSESGPSACTALPKLSMTLVTAWLLAEVATITGGSPPSTAARTQSEATTLCSSVVFPVPGGPLMASRPPSSNESAWCSASRWEGASACRSLICPR
jgi:hypothetical protein